MTKFQILVILSLVVVLSGISHAQSDAPDRFSISISGGFSFPVGSYANSNADQSANFNDGSGPYPFLLGFAKSQNGFATIGKYYNVELKYKVLKSWQLVFLAGNSVNPVDKVPISDYMSNYISDLYNSETAVTITHSDYGVRYLMPGIGYTFNRKGLIMETGILCGYAKSDYPSYRSYFNSHPPQYEYYGDDKSHPDPSTFIWGINGSAKYVFPFKMFIGAEITYLKADFDYTIVNRYVPGGSDSHPFNDVLNVRVLNTGFKVGYQF